jgi:hypothetical protein
MELVDEPEGAIAELAARGFRQRGDRDAFDAYVTGGR